MAEGRGEGCLNAQPTSKTKRLNGEMYAGSRSNQPRMWAAEFARCTMDRRATNLGCGLLNLRGVR